MRYVPNHAATAYIAISLVSLGVFAADVNTPLGTAVWVLYLVPLTATLLTWRPVAPVAAAVGHTVFLLLGLIVSPPGVDPQMGQANRAFAIVTVWIVAFVARRFVQGKLAVRRQEWLQTGYATLTEKMAGEQTEQQLGENVLRCLAEYTDAQAGAIYTRENSSFHRVATYAVPQADTVPERFAPGQGLLGQAAKDGRPFLVADVPEGYLTIGSSLGHSRPRHLLVAPVMVDGQTNAVLELGFVQPVGSDVTDLLERVSTAIALTVRSAKYRLELEQLLRQTQQQAEELQVQSDELRAANEELEQQSAALTESQSTLEQQQVELEETNSHLQEQARLLEAQRDELLRAKAVLEVQAKEIEQASKYKSDFLASMSHELRTPLNSALILARLLSENRGGNLTEEQVEFARTIEASGKALLDLINDVLDLAKVEAGRLDVRPHHVAVSKVVEGLRSMFAPVARQKGLGLHMRIAPDAPVVLETDAQRLEQVLQNLLSNAIKFTPYGEVRLEVQRTAGSRVAFNVHDTGIGIPEDQQQVIFEPFRQAESALNRRYGGTGLGLSISRELARLLGGEIQLQSAPGRGSTFTVVLPERYQSIVAARNVEEAPRAAAATVGGAPSGPAPAPIRLPAHHTATLDDDRDNIIAADRVVLVIEDDEVFAYILRDIAREMKFKCLIATSSAEALIIAAQHLPSAIVLDVGLPDNSGLTLLDRLKVDVRTRHIPVHIVSGHDYTETALSMGAVGYALKPVKREQLVDAFHRLEDCLTHRMRRVLVVEDDAVQRDALMRLLASREVDIVGVGGAAECLEQLRTASFDCMVLDLSLPDASGFSLLETISREDRYSFPPVIVYTGRELTADEEQTLRRYSQSVIIKGAKSPERLLDEVTLFLHQVVSQLPPEQQRMIERAHSRDAILEGRRVLVVEDDIRNIFALTSLLEPRGAKVEVARNGREALEVLERASRGDSATIDLVLMDIMMPEMDGLTATREIRKRAAWRDLPVIALTAKAMKDDHEQVIAAGANDYLAKPLDVDQFLSAVRVWMPR